MIASDDKDKRVEYIGWMMGESGESVRPRQARWSGWGCKKSGIWEPGSGRWWGKFEMWTGATQVFVDLLVTQKRKACWSRLFSRWPVLAGGLPQCPPLRGRYFFPADPKNVRKGSVLQPVLYSPRCSISLERVHTHCCVFSYFLVFCFISLFQLPSFPQQLHLTGFLVVPGLFGVASMHCTRTVRAASEGRTQR